MDIKEIRDKCGFWDEDLCECGHDHPEECPFHAECKEKADNDG